MPFFWLVICHMARNQIVRGTWLSWKMVPAVTDISYRQCSQSQRLRRIDQASAPAHRGQTHPSGQRNAARYSTQASSLQKRRSNSSNVLG